MLGRLTLMIEGDLPNGLGRAALISNKKENLKFVYLSFCEVVKFQISKFPRVNCLTCPLSNFIFPVSFG